MTHFCYLSQEALKKEAQSLKIKEFHSHSVFWLPFGVDRQSTFTMPIAANAISRYALLQTLIQFADFRRVIYNQPNPKDLAAKLAQVPCHLATKMIELERLLIAKSYSAHLPYKPSFISAPFYNSVENILRKDFGVHLTNGIKKLVLLAEHANLSSIEFVRCFANAAGLVVLESKND
jgi:hypothetical protein